MIKESLKIHGHRQFEIKQKVSFDHAKAKEIKYNVETYFFLPAALQINPQSYSTQEFQKSLKNYVRLSPATHKLRALYKDGGLLDSLARHIKIYAEHGVELDVYENELKRFALTYKRSLRLAVKGFLKAPLQKTDENVAMFLNDIAQTVTAYRALVDDCHIIETSIPSKAFEYCDEYISWVTTFYLRKLITEREMPLRLDISQAWREEINYREEKYPESIAKPGESNEEVLYRWSSLKRYISRYLFLDIRHKKGAPLLLHSIYGIAAAFSMIFATVIAFTWQGKYGALSFNLFIAMVIAYIFKDRLKEIGRDKLYKVFQRWIPDRKLMIYKEGMKKPIGICKESFRFLAHRNLPDEVKQLHYETYSEVLMNNEREEDILFYKKEVHLMNHHNLFEKTRFPIADITRFNISDYLKYIDVSFEELPFLEEDETPVLGEKTYHVYMIRRIRLHNDNLATELVRIVINVDGIKRLEVLKELKF